MHVTSNLQNPRFGFPWFELGISVNDSGVVDKSFAVKN